MRNRILICFLFSFLIVGSCKQHDLLLGERSPKDLKIGEAKSHFDKKIRQFKKTGRLQKLASANGLPANYDIPTTGEQINDIDISPLWNSAYEKLLSDRQAISIPLDIDSVSAYTMTADSTVVPFSSLNYLFMYKNDNEEIESYWVTYAPSTAWLSGDRSVYSGHILMRDFEGNLIQFYL